MVDCPDPSVMESFVRGSLDPEARARFEHHLDGCADCSQTMAELARLFGSASVAGFTPGGSMQVTVDTSSPGMAAGSAAASDSGAGAMVGRYRLGRALGAGGMGVVFEAHDPELDRQVAIKLLHPGQSDDAEHTRTRLLREARAMARLAHPNVVAVHDVGRVGEQVFVAMELVEGATLTGWLAARRRALAEIVDRFVQAGRGLLAAHEVGLVHRDFKPDNVLIGADERARVTDFGLARPVLAWAETEPMPAAPPGVDPLRVSTAVTTAFGTIAGTPAYMAPEQWRGEPVDARSDQFSFCVALYEAAFGVRPFDGDQWMTLCHNVLQGNLRPVPRSAPGWLRKALLKGLAVAPGQRYPSMAELLAQLSRDRSMALRVAAIGGAMALGAAATVGVLTWVADETTPSTAGPPVSAAAEAEAQTSPELDVPAEAKPDLPAAKPPPDPALEACLATAETVSGAYGTARRAALRERVGEMQEHADLISRVMPIADGWADAYRAQAAAVCAPGEGLALVAARRRCLEHRAARFDGWLSRVLALETFNARGPVVASAIELPPLSRCEQSPWLLGLPAPPTAAELGRVKLLRAELAIIQAEASFLRLTSAGPESERFVEKASSNGYAPLLAEAQYTAGVIAARRRDPDAAATWLEDAVATAEGVGHIEVQAQALVALIAEQGAYQLRPAAAAPWQRKARALVERTQDVALDAAVMLADGEVQRASFQLVVAKATLESAVRLATEAHGARDPRVGYAQVALARALLDRGDDAQALRWAQSAVTVLDNALGPGDLRLGTALTTLARAQLRVGSRTDAAVSAERARKIANSSSSIRHDYDRGDAMLVLGDIAAAEGDHEAALEQYEKAEIYHYQGPRMAQPPLHRGRYWLAQGDPAAAVEQMKVALGHLTTHYGTDDPRLVAVLRELGRAQELAGRIDDARTTLTRALELADTVFGFSAFRSRSQVDLGEFEQRQGNHARALKLFDDAHLMWLSAFEMHHPKVTATLLARADLAFELGQLDYAGRLYRTNTDDIETYYGAGSPEAARAHRRRTEASD